MDSRCSDSEWLKPELLDVDGNFIDKMKFGKISVSAKEFLGEYNEYVKKNPGRTDFIQPLMWHLSCKGFGDRKIMKYIDRICGKIVSEMKNKGVSLG